MNNNKFYDKNKKKPNFCVPTLVFIYDVWMKNRKKKLSVLRKLRSFSGLAGTKYTRDLYISANDELLFIKKTHNIFSQQNLTTYSCYGTLVTDVAINEIEQMSNSIYSFNYLFISYENISI